mmetsp:Transcript_69838/g.130485  ORF Transcript_69838/g.130485 Transcript_69838/m.130485 type:complete len:227 (+) Transcript_69838:802-1482(+)
MVNLFNILLIRRNTSSLESCAAASPCSLRFLCCAAQDSWETTRVAGSTGLLFPASSCRFCWFLTASLRQPPDPVSSLGAPPRPEPLPPRDRPDFSDFSPPWLSLAGLELLDVMGGRNDKPPSPPPAPGRRDTPPSELPPGRSDMPAPEAAAVSELLEAAGAAAGAVAGTVSGSSCTSDSSASLFGAPSVGTVVDTSPEVSSDSAGSAAHPSAASSSGCVSASIFSS